jgi:hypothetical protein
MEEMRPWPNVMYSPIILTPALQAGESRGVLRYGSAKNDAKWGYDNVDRVNICCTSSEIIN